MEKDKRVRANSTPLPDDRLPEAHDGICLAIDLIQSGDLGAAGQEALGHLHWALGNVTAAIGGQHVAN